MLRKPTQSSSYAATPLATTGRRRPTAGGDHRVVADDRHVGVGQWRAVSTARRAAATPASSNTVAVVVALEDPAVRAEQLVLVRVREHRRDRPLADAGVERHHLVVVVGHAGRAHREHRVGPARGRGRGPPQQPVADRAGSRGPATGPAPGRWASRGDTRSRVDGRGGTGLPETMSAVAIRTVVPAADPESTSITHQPSPHAVHVPSTSVSAGPPLGPGLAGNRSADHHPDADDVRSQPVAGFRVFRHPADTRVRPVRSSNQSVLLPQGGAR